MTADAGVRRRGSAHDGASEPGHGARGAEMLFGGSVEMAGDEDPDEVALRRELAERLGRIAAEDAALGRRDVRLSRARGLSFLAAVGLALVALLRPSLPLGLGALLAFALFVRLAIQHAQLATAQLELGWRRQLVRDALGRSDGSFRAEAQGPGDARARAERLAFRRGDVLAGEPHRYAADLDLFGPASLFEQLNVAHTSGGAARLGSWLREPAAADEIRARQRAARELGGKAELREELALAAMRAGRLHGDAAGLLRWAVAPAGLPRGVALAAALLCAVQLALGTQTLVALPVLVKPWLAAIGAQVLLLLGLRARLEPILGPLTAGQPSWWRAHSLIALLAAARFDDVRLRDLQARLRDTDGQPGAARALRGLDRLMGLAAVRHNAAGHLFANALLLWDVWCAWRLGAWRRAHGAALGAWLDAIAELEALCCLGSFAHEHPSFCWPVVATGEPRFVAADLGHPLLPASRRVGNDVALAGETRCLMITGSNMSGKSTLLRSLGVAAVLAQAGAPVCARSLTLTPLAVWTSIRVDDSLARGTSRFYAEVEKLKALLEAAAAPGPPPLFLLDEVLHGTNSRERNIGAKAVVRHLVDHGIGAVSSHDLGLVELAASTGGRVRNVHFEDHLAVGRMCFDYRMRPGPVGTSNALRLMRAVGITVVPLDDDPPAGPASSASDL